LDWDFDGHHDYRVRCFRWSTVVDISGRGGSGWGALRRFIRALPGSGYDLTRQAIMHPLTPTAIFGANNFIAIGIMKALRDSQLDVPADVSVVAFDDFPESMLVAPFLTFAEQPAYEMGRMATELLLKRISGELTGGYQKLFLPTQVIERGSTAPNRHSSD
jgi:LacI family transcriptional regulator